MEMKHTSEENNPNFHEGDKVTFSYASNTYEGTIVPIRTTTSYEGNADPSLHHHGLWVRLNTVDIDRLVFPEDIATKYEKYEYDFNVYLIPRNQLKLKVNSCNQSVGTGESVGNLESTATSHQSSEAENNSAVEQENTATIEKNTSDETVKLLNSQEGVPESDQFAEKGNNSIVEQETTTTPTTERDKGNTKPSEGLFSKKYTVATNQPLKEDFSRNTAEPLAEINCAISNTQKCSNSLNKNIDIKVDIDTGWTDEMASNVYYLRSQKSSTVSVEMGEDVARITRSSSNGVTMSDNRFGNGDYSSPSSTPAATYADKAKTGIVKQDGESTLHRMTNSLRSIFNIGSNNEPALPHTTETSKKSETNLPKVKVEPYLNHQTSKTDNEVTTMNCRLKVNGQRLQIGTLLAIRRVNKKGTIFEELGTVKQFVNGKNEVMACILLERSCGNFSGVYEGKTIFECGKNCGLIVPVSHFFEENSVFHILHSGNETETDVPMDIFPADPLTNKLASPISIHELKKKTGVQRGIQGKKNSCYIDTILFSLFALSDNFDYILEPNEEDSKNSLAGEVKNIISEQIVNPLRTRLLCPSKAVTNLRSAMESLSPKLVYAYMDAEEFLFLLFENCLHLDSFIHFQESSDYLHQIFIDDELNFLPPRFTTTQLLLEMSMCRSDIEFKTIPQPALILAMPRCDGQLKHFDKIIPNRQIDISLLMSSAPVECCVCQARAFYKCKSCFSLMKDDPGIKSTFFCHNCRTLVHAHESRMNHKIEKVEHRMEFPKENLNLLAVLCIKSHHYVCFVRCEQPEGTEWVFFDSDPASGKPMVAVLEGFEEKMIALEKNQNISVKEMKDLPAMMKRMLSDIYICIYVQPKEDEDL